MSHTLNVKAFFFNAKTDYLAYYKHFTLHLPQEATAKALLVTIKAENENFSFPENNLVFKINGLMVEGDTPLTTIIEKLGKQLQIDPANSYRSNNGLIINDDDFMKSYEILAPYMTAEDETYYKTLYALHYASETEKFDHSYIGDAILVLAHKMIEEGSIHKEAILKAITTPNSSLFDCEYENNLLLEEDHTTSINALKEMVLNDNDEQPSLLEMIRAHFGKEKKAPEKEEELVLQKARVYKDIESLEDKHIAYYAGIKKSNEKNISATIKSLGTKEIHFSRKNKLAGLSILKDNKDLALHKAGAIILDAYDSGAEVLVVEDEPTLDMFLKNFKHIENTIGRKINHLDFTSAKSFILQAQAIKAS
ncbi:MAG: hypothetical protein L3J43_08690 [Sulfurovum sp.]|nr:hypothetical protein [Sulfurovum sp.]